MARRAQLEACPDAEEPGGRYSCSKVPVEGSRWQFLWPFARRLTAEAIAKIAGYSAYWIARIARRYSRRRPDIGRDLRHQPRRAPNFWPCHSTMIWQQRWRQNRLLRAITGSGGRSQR